MAIIPPPSHSPTLIQANKPTPRRVSELTKLQKELATAISKANGNLTEFTIDTSNMPTLFIEDLKKVKTLKKIIISVNNITFPEIEEHVMYIALRILDSITRITKLVIYDYTAFDVPNRIDGRNHNIRFKLKRNKCMEQCKEKQSDTVTIKTNDCDSSAEMIDFLEHKDWDEILSKMNCQLHFSLRAIEGRLFENKRVAELLASGKVQMSASTYLCGNAFAKSPSEINATLFEGVHSISNMGYTFDRNGGKNKKFRKLLKSDFNLIDYFLKENKSVHTLSLVEADLYDNHVYRIESAIKTNTKLVSIDLSRNKFTVTAAEVLLNTVSKNPLTTDVRMERVPIEGRDLKSIAGTISENYSIVSLDITPVKSESTLLSDGRDDYTIPLKHSYSKLDSAHIDHYISRNRGYRNKAIIAIRDGEISPLKHLLKSGISPNAHDDEGKSLLHHAVMTSQFEIFKFLLEHGANAYWGDQWENPCTAYAINDDEANRFKALIDNHQPKMQKTKKRKREMDLSNDLDDGRSKRAKLTQAPIEVNMKAMKFITACQNGDLGYVKKRLADQNSPVKKQKWVNTQTPDGKTAAHHAAKGGHTDLLTFLIKNGADLSIADSNGKLVLHEAAASKKPDQIANLITCILNQDPSRVDAQDHYGLTALYILAGGFEEYPAKTDKECAAGAYVLLAKGARPNMMIGDPHLKRTMNALHKAIYNGFYTLTKTLVQSGSCDLNQSDSKGWSPLHHAVMAEMPMSVEILRRLLIEPDINSRITNDSRKTPLALLKNRPTNSAVKEMTKEIDARESRHQLGDSQSGTVWTKSLKVHYGSKEGKRDLSIDLTKTHETLRDRFDRLKGYRGNYVTGHLTFVASDAKHSEGGQHRRIKISIELISTDEKIHVSQFWGAREPVQLLGSSSSIREVKWRCPSTKQRILKRYKKAPEDSKRDSVDDCTIADGRLLSTKGIEMAYHSEDFELIFHHSEQALISHLEQQSTQRAITAKLQEFPEFKTGAKVYAVILSLHSTNYVCKNCEVTLLGGHKILSKNFGNTLKKLGYILPRNGLKILTTVTADTPYKCQRKMKEDHREYTIDLRSLKNNGLILSQDATVITPHDTVFPSRNPRYG